MKTASSGNLLQHHFQILLIPIRIDQRNRRVIQITILKTLYLRKNKLNHRKNTLMCYHDIQKHRKTVIILTQLILIVRRTTLKHRRIGLMTVQFTQIHKRMILMIRKVIIRPILLILMSGKILLSHSINTTYRNHRHDFKNKD